MLIGWIMLIRFTHTHKPNETLGTGPSLMESFIRITLIINIPQSCAFFLSLHLYSSWLCPLRVVHLAGSTRLVISRALQLECHLVHFQ